MARKSFYYSRRNFYRFALLLLIIIPFVPEIIILATKAIALLVGCEPNQKDLCRIGWVAASDVIGWVLHAKAGFIIAHAGNLYWLIGFYATVAVWIVACYAVLIFGWTWMWSRLLLGFAVAVIFTVLPYFGLILALGNLVNENCKSNAGGVGACMILGGQVGSADYSLTHAAGALGWGVIIGGPLAFGIFAGYAIGVMFACVRAPDAQSARSSCMRP